MPLSKARKAGGAQEKLRQLGHLAGTGGSAAPAKSKQLTFEIFFPRPGSGTPYRGAQYRAARGKDGLYNFVGLVLGHGGATVQRIQRSSGAKIEVRDSAGNLNGAHPSSHGDPSLHAWVAAASRQRLEKAVHLLLEVLAPTNTTLRPVTVLPGACAVLEPHIPSDWPEAAKEAAVERARGAGGKAGAAKANMQRAPPSPAANAWASNRLLRQHGQGQQGAAPGSPQAEHTQHAEQALDRTDSGLSAASSGAGTEDDAAATAVDPCKGSNGGPESPASVVPPPPPPRRSQPKVQPPTASAAPLSAEGAAMPAPRPAGAATTLASQAGQASPPAPMATVWAKGLHAQEGPLETPGTPCGAAERVNPLAPERSSTAGSAASWSLWDAGSSGSASSFYEELQAAAQGLGPAATAAPAATLAPRQLLHSNSWPQSHSQAERSSLAALLQHNQATALPLPLPLPPAAVPAQPAAPFPGLRGLSPGLAQSLGSYSMPALQSAVGVHSTLGGLGVGHSAGVPAHLPPCTASHHYPGPPAEPAMAPSPRALDPDVQQLLALLASMAALR